MTTVIIARQYSYPPDLSENVTKLVRAIDGGGGVKRTQENNHANLSFGKIRPEGFEPPTYGLEIRDRQSATTDAVARSENSLISVAPKVVTDTAENGCERMISLAESDPELARLVAAWPSMSAVVKRMILAALDAADRADEFPPAAVSRRRGEA